MLNKTILMGRLVADPELTHTPQELAVCHFRIAVERPGRSDSTNERKADFLSVVAWRKTAEFVAKYFVKGQQIVVTGRLTSDEYTDKNGIKRYPIEVVADEIYFAGIKRTPEGEPAPEE